MAHGTPKSILDMLAAVPLFSTCTKPELERIANLGTELTVADGTTLTTQGRPGREFFLLVDGAAHLEIDGAEIGALGTGDFFGEMSLLDGHPRTATVVASGSATVIAFNASEFHSLLDSAPSINEKIRAAAAERDRGPATT
jgi:CRP-like cAMP-binding protein